MPFFPRVRGFCISLFSPVPGALGILLRNTFYPRLFGSVGRGVIFAAGIRVRNAGNIHIGDGAILDDNLLIDAAGGKITIGARCYVGRGSRLSTLNGGSILLEAQANFSTFTRIIADGGKVVVGAKTLMGPHDHLAGGANGIAIGPACWLGAHVTVADGASVGGQTVMGAAATIADNLPAKVLAVGSPARVVKRLGTG